MIALEQSELSFAPPAPAPAVTEVDRFVQVLQMQSDWLTAADLITRMGLPPTEQSRRFLRIWANASDGRVISGQKGYRHIDHATAEEIVHASRWLIHQAKEMEERGRAILRRAHQNL